MQANTTIVRKEGLSHAAVDDEVIILNMATNSYVALDATGRKIWDLLDKPVTVDHLCNKLSQQFSAPLSQIAADVMPFLAELRTEGLLHEVPASHQ